jgi:hypothetical protein
LTTRAGDVQWHQRILVVLFSRKFRECQKFQLPTVLGKCCTHSCNDIPGLLLKVLDSTYIWIIALYGPETWTLRAVDQKHLVGFEMWRWRTMEKISWTDHVRTEEVLLESQGAEEYPTPAFPKLFSSGDHFY